MIRTIVALAAAGLALAGCSSSGGSSPASSSAPGRPVSASVLANDLSQHVAPLTAAHLDIDAQPLGLRGSGDVAFRNGQPYASDFTLDQGAGKTQVITTGGVSYAKLPAGQQIGDRPWVVVKSTSSNEFVRALASTLTLIGGATSLTGIAQLLTSAATDVRDLGDVQISGFTSEHYTMLIDPRAAKGPLGEQLAAVATKPLPVDVWIRTDGFPAKVQISVPLGSKAFPVVVEIGKFFEPVRITAPPANEVSTG